MGQDTGTNGAQPARSSRARLLLRVLLIGVPALLLLIAGGCFLTQKYSFRVRPTGDELFDRYASLVNGDIARGKYRHFPMGSSAPSGFAAVLPDDTLEDWEDDFGDDPRYWEMRFSFADNNGIANKVEFLKRAVDDGIATSNTRLLYYAAEKERWEEEIDNLPYHEERGAYTAAELALCRETHARVEQEQLALLDSNIAAAPDSAWAYYNRAFYWFELGEMELGLADLESGNAAADTTYPYPFPMSFAIEEIAAGRVPGCKPVCGAIWELSIAYDMPNFIRIKDALKDTSAAVELGLDRARTANAWQGYACRLGSDQETVIASLVGLVLLGIVDGWYWDYEDDLTESQLAALEQHKVARNIIKHRVKDSHEEYNMVTDISLQLWLNPIFGYHKTYYKGFVFDMSLVNDFRPIFADLNTLDYSTLEMPPGLAQYKLTQEWQAEEDERAARRKENSEQ